MFAHASAPSSVTGLTPVLARRRWWLSRALFGWMFAGALLAAAAAVPIFVNEQAAVAERGVHAAITGTVGSTSAALAPAWVGFVQAAHAVARSEVRFHSAPAGLAAAVSAIPLESPLLGVRIVDLNGDIIAQRVAGQFDFPTTTDLFADPGPRRLRVHPGRAGRGGARIVPFSQVTTDVAGRPIAVVAYVDTAPLGAALRAAPVGHASPVAEVMLVTDDGALIAAPGDAAPALGLFARLNHAPPAADLLDGEIRTFGGRLRSDQPNQTVAYARIPNWPLLAVAASTGEWLWLSSRRVIQGIAVVVGVVVAIAAMMAVIIGERWRRHRAFLVHIRANAKHAERALASTNAAIVSWRPGVGGVIYSPRWKRMLGIADGELSDQLEELLDRVHPSDKPAVLRNLHSLATGEISGRQIMYRLIAKDGEVKQIIESSAAERTADGQTRAIVLTQMDLTQLRHDAAGNTNALLGTAAPAVPNKVRGARGPIRIHTPAKPAAKRRRVPAD